MILKTIVSLFACGPPAASPPASIMHRGSEPYRRPLPLPVSHDVDVHVITNTTVSRFVPAVHLLPFHLLHSCIVDPCPIQARNTALISFSPSLRRGRAHDLEDVGGPVCCWGPPAARNVLHGRPLVPRLVSRHGVEVAKASWQSVFAGGIGWMVRNVDGRGGVDEGN